MARLMKELGTFRSVLSFVLHGFPPSAHGAGLKSQFSLQTGSAGWVPHSALELALDGNAAAEPCSLGTAQSPPCALLPPSLGCGCAALQAVCCSIRPFVQECLFGFHAGRVTLP